MALVAGPWHSWVEVLAGEFGLEEASWHWFGPHSKEFGVQEDAAECYRQLSCCKVTS